MRGTQLGGRLWLCLQSRQHALPIPFTRDGSPAPLNTHAGGAEEHNHAQGLLTDS